MGFGVENKIKPIILRRMERRLEEEICLQQARLQGGNRKYRGRKEVKRRREARVGCMAIMKTKRLEEHTWVVMLLLKAHESCAY